MANEWILVVDDEADAASVLERFLSGAGYQVGVAGTVAAAIEALRSRSYTVCILDLRLPDGDGLEVLRFAQGVGLLTEVIILTGYADVPSAVEALRLGAYDYLEKPVQDLRLILITVARALERMELTKRNRQLLHDLRAANKELEVRRQQQLGYIKQIGQALAGALHEEDVAQVLVHSLLDATGCDVAGLLLSCRAGKKPPCALLGSRQPLAPAVHRGLMNSMLSHLPDPARPALADVKLEQFARIEDEAPEDEPVHCSELRLISCFSNTKGVVAIGRHSEGPFSEEELSFFSILVNQGSAALANAQLFARANELATRDGLTELYNHRHFYELLEAEISRSERYGERFALLMVDMDRTPTMGLKAVNDTYGHQAGDQLLKSFAKFLASRVRRADVVARYGGDEFAILAPETDRREAHILAQRICDQVRKAPLVVNGHVVHVTVSVGVAVFEPGPRYEATRVVGLADRGMYLAKEAGGNRVCLVELDGSVYWDLE